MKIRAPFCIKCKKDAMLADAGLLQSIPYWYCKTCKIEVDDWGFEVAPAPHELEAPRQELAQDDLVSVYDPFLKKERKVKRSEWQLKRSPSEVSSSDDEEGGEEDDEEFDPFDISGFCPF